MNRLASVILFVIVVLVVSAGAKALVNSYFESVDTSQNTAEARTEYKKIYVDSCIQGGGEYGVYPGFSDYCGCTFDVAEEQAGSWQKGLKYVQSLSEEEMVTFVGPCMVYIQQA